MHRKRRRLTRATRRSMAQQAATTKAQAASERAARREAAAQTTAKLSETLHTAKHTHLDRLVRRAFQNGPDLTISGLDRKLVDGFLRAVLSKRPRLADEPYVAGLEYLVHVPWSGDPADWRPEGSGSRMAVRSLAQHLLGPYRIPVFLIDSLLDEWLSLDDGVLQLRTAALVGGGDSLYRDGRGTFVPLTLNRRMCHELLHTPTGLDLDRAVRRAQVLGNGGSEQLARLIISRLWYVRDEEFIAEVLRWLCTVNHVDGKRLSSVYAYLWVTRLANPAFRLHGRSWQAVVRAMDNRRHDHDVLDRLESDPASRRGKRPTQFVPSGFVGFLETQSKVRKGRVVDIAEWTTREILTPLDLIDEGREMMHCVVSYADAIAAGRSSIWSLKLNGRRCLTIEVANASREIAQMCGKTNRPPRPQEHAVVLAWAKLNGLSIVPPP